MVAYQCINSRVAIAHGKQTELKYRNSAAIKNATLRTNVKMVFDFFGGTKELAERLVCVRSHGKQRKRSGRSHLTFATFEIALHVPIGSFFSLKYFQIIYSNYCYTAGRSTGRSTKLPTGRYMYRYMHNNFLHSRFITLKYSDDGKGRK